MHHTMHFCTRYGPGKGWFAGVMQWDVGSSTMNVQGGKSFAQTVSGYLKSAGSCGASQPIPQPPPTATQPSPTRTATSDAPQPTVGTCPVPGSSCNPSIDAPRCAANGGTAKCTRGSAKFWLVTNCPKGTVCKMTRPGRPFCAAPVASDPPLCGGSQPLPAPSPTSTAGPAPTSAPVPCPSAPKPGAKCSTGSDGATCATSNEYAVCVYGTWVVQPCASGTVCKRVNGGGGFVCDWPSTRSEEAVCKDGTMTISGLSPMEKAVLP